MIVTVEQLKMWLAKVPDDYEIVIETPAGNVTVAECWRADPYRQYILAPDSANYPSVGH
jgi:hypothetical protein